MRKYIYKKKEKEKVPGVRVSWHEPWRDSMRSIFEDGLIRLHVQLNYF